MAASTIVGLPTEDRSHQGGEGHDAEPWHDGTGEPNEALPDLGPGEPRAADRRVLRDEKATRYEERSDAHLAVHDERRERPERPESEAAYRAERRRPRQTASHEHCQREHDRRRKDREGFVARENG